MIHSTFEVMSLPWRWGDVDCCGAACRAFDRVHGFDPMADLRGTYSDRAGAYRIIRPFGSLAAFAEDLALNAGLSIGRGLAGEIGVSQFGKKLFTGEALAFSPQQDLWIGKTMTGFCTVPAPEVTFHV